LFSAICYSFYATYLQIKISKTEEATFNFSYLLAAIGLFNVIAFVPTLFIFDSTEIEVFSLPDKTQLIMLTVNGFVANFVFDYCYMRSVILLGPLQT
jgi:drug/metabolite transporter (DMT)-like permease